MYERIIVPIDIADIAKATQMIAAARQLGGASAKIILVNAVEDIPTHAATYLPGDVFDELRKKSIEQLKYLAKTHKLEGGVEIGHGRAHDVILQTAEENNADAIIIASHRPGLQDYLLGSTAARVVRHAKCSVLVLR